MALLFQPEWRGRYIIFSKQKVAGEKSISRRDWVIYDDIFATVFKAIATSEI